MKFYTPRPDASKINKSYTINHELPMVLIIGDSISIGYTPHVQKILMNKINIIRPDTNCGDTVNGLANINEWLGKTKWDLIHFNWGLHDLCYRHPESKNYGNRDKVHGKISVNPAQYKENLQKLVGTIRNQSDSLVWANTTFIPEGEAGRHQRDDEIYNQIAKDVMIKNNIVINDLWSLTSTFDKSLFTCEGDVHYTQEGYRTIARQVVASIQNRLSN